jgi:hypothetical protein
MAGVDPLTQKLECRENYCEVNALRSLLSHR